MKINLFSAKNEIPYQSLDYSKIKKPSAGNQKKTSNQPLKEFLIGIKEFKKLLALYLDYYFICRVSEIR